MRNLLLASLLLTSAFQSAFADTFGEWTYTVSNNQATITGYTGAGGALVIPGSVNSYTVVSIGRSAFQGTGLTSVTIPNSVTSIENNAFHQCYALTSVTLGSGVTFIGEFAFVGTGITSLTIPNGWTSIPIRAFLDCASLISVTIPNSVTSIGRGAFQGTGLTSVTIPNSVTSIENNAFHQCYALTSVTLGSGVTFIGEFAFVGTGITSLTIPNGWTSIPIRAFLDCASLISVTIPNSVTSIGRSAFQGTGLTSITIPSSVTSIGSTAFEYCPLVSVFIPSTITSSQISQAGFPSSATFYVGTAGAPASTVTQTELATTQAQLTTTQAQLATIQSELANIQLQLDTATVTLATKSELTSSLAQSRTDGINSVLSNPNLWTLYTTSQIQNMAVGDLVLTKDVAGTLTLNYDIEQSADLVTWTTYQALSLPLSGLPKDKAFVRIKAKQ